MTHLARLLVLGVWFTVGCVAGCAAAKPPLQAVDASLTLACQGMAQALAARSGVNASQLVEKTCAVESFTRTLREMLLSQQLQEAKAAGVLVPDINSGALETPPEDAVAE